MGAATTTPCCCPTARWSQSAAASASETATNGPADPEQRQVELWNPATGTWTLGPAQAESRAYHSTALLLPDGRVVSAGDDVNGGTDRDTAEIYEPPYLFKGARPTITSAPTSAQIGTTFNVDTPDTNITKATLVAPGATTHANDMNQRYIPLTVAQRAGGVTLTAPASAELATPGYYMLFLLNAQGVPSSRQVHQPQRTRRRRRADLIEKAAGRPAQASSMYSSTYAPGKAVDGSSTTRWSSNFTDNQWWQVDLGSVRKVSKVDLNWEAAYASQYKIQTSTDGTTFTDAAVVSSTGAGLKSTTFADRDARYVRVLGVTRATQYGISFWDARVYGSSDTAPPPPPPPPPPTTTWRSASRPPPRATSAPPTRPRRRSTARRPRAGARTSPMPSGGRWTSAARSR